MINFSALPVKKTAFFGPKLYVISIISSFLVAAIVMIIYSMGGSSGIVFEIFRVIGILFAVGVTIGIPIIIIWFFKDLLLPRYRWVRDGKPMFTPAYDRIPPLQKFADDNGFVFTNYPPRTFAPKELFYEIMSPGPEDSIYILHKIDGKISTSNFSFYCLAYALALTGGNYRHSSMAYAHLSDNRAVDYFTVWMTDGPFDPCYTQSVYKSTTTPYTYIKREGQVTDQKSAQEMFGLIVTKQAL